ncbi:TetR/AcrR family transcriptional regulator C-terminal domain-containing protein, partial [Salmonella enterica subsp. enterica serovar Infantis]
PRAGARSPAAPRPGAPPPATAAAQLRSLRSAGFSAGDAVKALMTMGYFTVGAVLAEPAGDREAGVGGGPGEQAARSRGGR